MTWAVVSVHDVAPATVAASARWLDLLEPRVGTTTLLVVPGPWRGHGSLDGDSPAARETVGFLHHRAVDGHEIALHGWEHRAVPSGGRSPLRRAWGTCLARGAAEFWTLDPDDAMRRIECGRRTLARVGLGAEGFVAPGWLLGARARAAVVAAGFRYTTSHLAVLDLQSGARWPAPALSQRPGSTLTGSAAVLTGAAAARLARAGRPMRIAAHPGDLADRRCRSAVLDAVTEAREHGYRFLTYAALVRNGPAGDR